MSDIVKRLQDEATYIKKHGLDQDVDMFDLPAVIMQDAAAEIELLRESRDAVIRKAKERVKRVEQSYVRQFDLREEAEQRIEELEAEQCEIGGVEFMKKTGRYVITTEQIDAAWNLVMDTGEDGRINSGAEQSLARVGIVRCEGCGGCGQVQVYTKDDDYDADGCPDCDGHGWMIGGEDE